MEARGRRVREMVEGLTFTYRGLGGRRKDIKEREKKKGDARGSGDGERL